jgi:hypothetical protein
MEALMGTHPTDILNRWARFLGTTSVFKGTIMADQSIALNTGATVEGRLLARIGAVTLAGNTIVKPAL